MIVQGIYEEEGANYSQKFLEVLETLGTLYTNFPKFIIEIWAENYGIPSSEVKKLICAFKKNGTLSLVKNAGYCYQLNRIQQ